MYLEAHLKARLTFLASSFVSFLDHMRVKPIRNHMLQVSWLQIDHEKNNYSFATFFNNIKVIYVSNGTTPQVVNLAHYTSITKVNANIDDKN